MWLSVCLSVCLTICLSIYLTFCLSVCLSVCPCVSLYLSHSVCVYVCQYDWSCVCLSIHTSIRPSIFWDDVYKCQQTALNGSLFHACRPTAAKVRSPNEFMWPSVWINLHLSVCVMWYVDKKLVDVAVWCVDDEDVWCWQVSLSQLCSLQHVCMTFITSAVPQSVILFTASFDVWRLCLLVWRARIS